MIPGQSAPCVVLPWDTEFFNCRIGRVLWDTLNSERALKVDSWAQENGIECLYFLARSDDPLTVCTAEARGYRLVDVRLAFERTMRGPARSETPQKDLHAIRPFREKDLSELQAIARRVHTQTRFYNDPHFQRDRVEEFYSTWITRDSLGGAEQILVALSAAEKPIGYISCLTAKTKETGQIGLVGVSTEAQGRGVGTELLLAAINWFSEKGVGHISVVTQGNNLAAQRVYQRCGFVTQQVHLWFHKWYSSHDT